MRRWAGLLAAGLILAGCADLGTCAVERVTRAPLRSGGGYWYTDLRIDGHVANMLVDTGAEFTLLRPLVAGQWDIPVEPAERPMRTNGVGGFRMTRILRPGRIQLGDAARDAFPITSADWLPPAGNPPADGLLGSDVLGKLDIDYDAAGGGMGLYKVSGRCGRPPGLGGTVYVADMLPKRPPSAGAFVTVVIGGQEFRALLDTGAQRTTMFRAPAARLGLDYDALARERGALPSRGIGPRVVGFVPVRVPAMTVGGLTVRDIDIAVADEEADSADMLLGQDFLRLTHVWVSNFQERLFFQVPPRPTGAP